ncbi:hypothetical protein IWW55_001225 [Coemansia sp. RSA 2706]|nr:hypothetical protein IWW55_001225 [Coemansia sp. RSA 2706]KAJ2739175.1 hypothetical protein H4R23_000653 [Coemansia sp. Cherry 401B]
MSLALVARALDADRIQAAAAHGISLDPVGGVDKATIAVGIAFFGLTFVLLVYAWCNRDYQPIRAKNLPQASVMFVSGVLWFVGDIAVNGHVDLAGGWAKCRLWALWIRLMFVLLFSCCVFVRVYALYWLFVRRQQFRGWKPVVPYLIAMPCVFVFCLAGQLASPSVTMRLDGEMGLCVYSRAFHISTLVLQWIMWALVMVFMWLIRNIQASFNEMHESLLIVLITLLSLVQNTVVGTVRAPIAAHSKGRNATTWVDFIDTNFTIWIILIWPVVQSIFNRSAYLALWRARLVDEGFRRGYDVSDTANHVETTVCSLDLRPASVDAPKDDSAWLYRTMYADAPELPGAPSAVRASLSNIRNGRARGTFSSTLTAAHTLVSQPSVTIDKRPEYM